MRDLLRFDPFQTVAFLPQALERQEALFVPDFEVREAPEAYIFKADLPGDSVLREARDRFTLAQALRLPVDVQVTPVRSGTALSGATD